MSSPALPASRPAPLPWREQAVALGALLRRDLLGGSRGAGVLWMRGLAIVVAGGAALLAFAMTSAAVRNEVASVAAMMLLLGLMALGFVQSVPVAVTSLRREREAGMLDLLMLAGIRPGTLAMGRTLSTWFFLLSLLLAALPGIALLWFYRQPSLPGLALAAAQLALHFLALAAVAVAISAWSRNAGFAIAAAIVIMGAWVLALCQAPNSGWPLASALVMSTILDPLIVAVSGSGLQPASAWDHALGAGLNAVVAVAAWRLAVAGLKAAPPRVERDRLRERIDRKGRPLNAAWAMTWLLQRRSAPARPAIQALVIVPFAAWAIVGGPEFAAAAGALCGVAGLVAAAALAATAIAPERERRAWESIAATGREGSEIARDLLGGVLAGSAVPVLASAVLGVVASVLADGSATLVPVSIAVVSSLVSWVLVAVAGLALSSSTSRTAAALASTAAFVLAEPLLGLVGIGVLSSVAGRGHAGSTLASSILLVHAAAFGGTWLVLRTRWRSPRQAVVAFLPAALLCVLPAWLSDGRVIAFFVPFVALGAAGLVLLISGLRRARGFAIVAGVGLIASCTLVPYAGNGLRDAESALAAVGGFAWPWLQLSTVLDGEDQSAYALALGLAHHGVLLWALLASFLPRLDRMLGRSEGATGRAP